LIFIAFTEIKTKLNNNFEA